MRWEHHPEPFESSSEAYVKISVEIISRSFLKLFDHHVWSIVNPESTWVKFWAIMNWGKECKRFKYCKNIWISHFITDLGALLFSRANAYIVSSTIIATYYMVHIISVISNGRNMVHLIWMKNNGRLSS